MNLDVSDNGTLVYQTGEAQAVLRTLVWVNRDGVEETLAAEPRPYFEVQLSPDSRRVAAEVRDPDNTDIWVYDLTRDVPTRFTFDDARDLWPLWTLDGERIVFSSTRDTDGAANLYWKSADGIGPVERLTTSTSTRAQAPTWPGG